MSREIELCTIQITKARTLPFSFTVIDTTVMTGNLAFAPTWAMVHGIKNKTLSEKAYQDQYYRMMQESQIALVKEWESLKQHKRIALACYCRAGLFCHRHLLKTIITEYLEKDDYEVFDNGEYEPS